MRPMVDDLGVTKALRRTGFGVLAAVIVIEALTPIVTRWRRAAAARAIDVANRVAPTENVLLDVALVLLRTSDDRRS